MTQLITWIETFAGMAEKIAYALGLASLVVIAIIFFTGGQRAMEKGKSLIINILIGICILSFGGGIFASLMK